MSVCLRWIFAFAFVLVTANLLLSYMFSENLVSLTLKTVKSFETSATRITKRRILIITSRRSGSTFASQLLASVPTAYLQYEPLYQFKHKDLSRAPHLLRKAEEMITQLFRCNYEHPILSVSLRFQEEYLRKFMFSRNQRVWEACHKENDDDDALCYNPVFLRDTCQQFPIKVMKVVRLPLSSADALLNRLEDLQIIYLVRDPRSTLHSRRKLSWCRRHPECVSPDFLCQQLDREYKQSQTLERHYKKRFTILRYEDLASNPSNTSRQLFNWLGIQWRAEVDQYILNHTQYDDRDPHGTIRLLGSRIAPWTNWTKINSIQDTCRDALLSFGYYIPAALSNSTSPGISSSNNQTTFASVFKCNFLSTAD